MLNVKIVRTIGLVASLVGLGANVVNGWVGEKIMEKAVQDEVAKAIAKMVK